MEIRLLSRNFTTPSQLSEDNASLTDEEQPRHKGWEIALEKDTHVRPASGSAPKRSLAVHATPGTRPAKEDKPAPNWSLFSQGIAFVMLSFVLFVHQRELTPLFASVPTNKHLLLIAWAATVIASVEPIRIPLVWNSLYATLAFLAAPKATYSIAVVTARERDPVCGPALTHLLTLAPLTFLLSTFAAQSEDGFDSLILSKFKAGQRHVAKAGIQTLRPTLSLLLAFALSKKWATSPALRLISDSQIYLALAFIPFNAFIAPIIWNYDPNPKSTEQKKAPTQASASPLLWNAQTKFATVVGVNAAFLALVPFFANAILSHPLYKTYRHPTLPLEVLSAEQSVTGLITVAQWLPDEKYDGPGKNIDAIRYMRADHVILGGVWVKDKVRMLDEDHPPLQDISGAYLGDSVFYEFVVQEAVRMVDSTEVGKSGKWDSALVIGLKTGSSATTLMRHDIKTTIVEIDPAVYRAARTYFALPDAGKENVFLEDARGWVSKQKKVLEAGKQTKQYDIVMHDCFSGFGVPEHMFTTEFWGDLRALMKPEGVIVVNYPGFLKSESSRLVINTLEKSFGQCRAFHNLPGALAESSYDKLFVSMVLFCTSSEKPLTFRKTRKSDWFSSPLRQYILKSLSEREINLDAIRDKNADEPVLSDNNNPLGALQAAQVPGHWKAAREVLIDVHWETF